MATRPTVIPTRPANSNGLRPKRSTHATAISVAKTFTSPTAMKRRMGLLLRLW